ncbi:MAG TPA: hypothetical protein VFM49_31590 [Chloroflexia bacterium]|jgi:hypothetical protein|nr:hypothetical protein [Chloroflexia bacterium]
MSSEDLDTNVNAGSDPAPEREAIPFRRPPNRRRFTMRYTIIDPQGSISFVGPCQGLKALVAACAQDSPRTAEDLLAAAGEYDSDLRDSVLNGLHVFDEHNLPGNYAAIHAALQGQGDEAGTSPVFRVVDDVTRQASLQPVKAGLVLFNLKQKRIVQIQNTYADIEREDRGRVRKKGRVTGRYYDYRLPPDWQVLP